MRTNLKIAYLLAIGFATAAIIYFIKLALIMLGGSNIDRFFKEIMAIDQHPQMAQRSAAGRLSVLFDSRQL